MKGKYILLAATILLSQLSFSQEKNLKGSFIPEAEAKGITANVIQIKISDNSFTASMHLRQNMVVQIFSDKRDHSNDYTDISGNGGGTITGNELNGSVNLIVEENEVGVVSKHSPPARIRASISGNEVNGKLIVGDENDEPTIISFKAVESGNEKPELTYPAGKSPKVFDKGWIFGASFSLMNEKGEFIDLSDEVEWSGTANFSPAKGKESRPAFKNPGNNKIILSVKYDGKVYKSEYPIETVSHLLYGHIGTIASCPADYHGCMACPHKTIGAVSSGSKIIMAGEYPAARVGDRGITIGCCGESYFTITNGDQDVMIEGKPAAKIFISATNNCGGTGQLTGGYSEIYLWANDGAAINDATGKKSEKTEIETGDVLKTDAKGMIAFPGNSQCGISLFPNSVLKILEQTKEKIRILLETGHLLVTCNTDAYKKILVFLKDFSITPAGTKFLVFTDSTGLVTVDVYEGTVNIHHLSNDKTITVDSGFSFRYSNGMESVAALAPGSEANSIRTLVSAADSKSAKIKTAPEPGLAEKKEAVNKSNGSFISKKKLYIAGGAVVLLVLFILLLKRKKKVLS